MAKIEKEYAVKVRHPYDNIWDEYIPMKSKKKARKYVEKRDGYFERCDVVSRPKEVAWKVIEPSPYRE